MQRAGSASATAGRFLFDKRRRLVQWRWCQSSLPADTRTACSPENVFVCAGQCAAAVPAQTRVVCTVHMDRHAGSCWEAASHDEGRNFTAKLRHMRQSPAALQGCANRTNSTHPPLCASGPPEPCSVPIALHIPGRPAACLSRRTLRPLHLSCRRSACHTGLCRTASGTLRGAPAVRLAVRRNAARNGAARVRIFAGFASFVCSAAGSSRQQAGVAAVPLLRWCSPQSRPLSHHLDFHPVAPPFLGTHARDQCQACLRACVPGVRACAKTGTGTRPSAGPRTPPIQTPGSTFRTKTRFSR